MCAATAFSKSRGATGWRSTVGSPSAPTRSVLPQNQICQPTPRADPGICAGYTGTHLGNSVGPTGNDFEPCRVNEHPQGKLAGLDLSAGWQLCRRGLTESDPSRPGWYSGTGFDRAAATAP